MKFNYGWILQRASSSLTSFLSESSGRRKEFNKIMKIDRINFEKALRFEKLQSPAVSRNRIITNSKMIQKLPVQSTSLEDITHCLLLKNLILEHWIMLLEEFGIPKVNLSLIHKMPYLMYKSMKEFRRITKIPDRECIMRSISHHVGIDPSNLPQNAIQDKTPMNVFYTECLLHHCTQKLGEPCRKVKNSIPTQFKSFRLLTNILDLLMKDIGLEAAFVNQHIYLTSICPHNAQLVWTNLRDTQINGMQFSELIRKWPYLLECDFENINKLLKSFAKYNIEDASIVKCLPILKLDNSTFVERMEYILNDPDIHIFSYHPRILYFILGMKMSVDRMNFLYLLNRNKWISGALLMSHMARFQRFVQYDNIYCRHVKYLKRVLYKELGEDKEGLINIIKRHPNWKFVPISHISEMLRYLKQQYSVEDICKSIHIILYPRSAVSDALEVLHYQYECTFTPAQYLALCVYMLEKDNYFSGDGIWNSRQFTSENRKRFFKKDTSSPTVIKNLDYKISHIVNDRYLSKTCEEFERTRDRQKYKT